MSHRLVLDGGGQRHSLTYSCCPGSRVLPLSRMYFQGRIRLFGAEDRREKPRSCDMPGIPNQVVVVTGNQEVVTEALGHSWRPRPTGRPDGVSPERPGCPKTDPPRRPVRVGIIDVRMAPHPHVEGAYLADPDRLDLLPEDGGRPL